MRTHDANKHRKDMTARFMMREYPFGPTDAFSDAADEKTFRIVPLLARANVTRRRDSYAECVTVCFYEENTMRIPALLALLATISLAACGGGGGGSATPPVNGGGSNSGNSSQTQSENAIVTAESLGSPVKSISSFNGTTSGASLATRTSGFGIDIPVNQCVNGVEFFVPDKNNDKNSTEEQYFYDSACTQIARDIVRIFAISGTSETVNRTVKQYALNNATPTAQRTTTVNFINGTFGNNGFPNVANGFGRSATSELDISGAKTLLNDDELVMSPGTNGVNSFCGDAAGYNATGVASLNETFGSQGSTTSGTRTVNGDGSVTWQSTHMGSVFKGAIGSLAINIGSANSACPISTPEYTLAGGTSTGSYTIPVTVTYLHGEIVNLSVTNATLANGNSLNVTTNTSLSPTNNQFITGIVANNGTQIATFNVNTFGDGALTITSSGAQFVMNDWHVVRYRHHGARSSVNETMARR